MSRGTILGIQAPQRTFNLVPCPSGRFSPGKKWRAARLGSQKAAYKSRGGILDNDSHAACPCAPATTADILFGGRPRQRLKFFANDNPVFFLPPPPPLRARFPVRSRSPVGSISKGTRSEEITRFRLFSSGSGRHRSSDTIKMRIPIAKYKYSFPSCTFNLILGIQEESRCLFLSLRKKKMGKRQSYKGL